MTIAGWTLHGSTAPTKLLAGILPARGLHVLTGNDARINMALAADLAVALAAGPLACGFSLPEAEARWGKGGDRDTGADVDPARAQSTMVVGF